MRTLLIIALTLVSTSCGDDDCCTVKRDASIDAAPDAPPFCGATMKCPMTNQCGTNCCNPGEWCVPDTATCRCGSGPACMVGDECAAPGPIGPSQCGSICCGPASGTPCPL